METKEDIQTAGTAFTQDEGESLGSSKDLESYGTSGETSSSPARITEIDISESAKALGYLRLCDYGLVVGCGSMAVSTFAGAISSFIKGDMAELMYSGPLAAILMFITYTGWRHVGMIDQRVWGSYLWAFPILAIVSLFGSLPIIEKWCRQGTFFHDLLSLFNFRDLLSLFNFDDLLSLFNFDHLLSLFNFHDLLSLFTFLVLLGVSIIGFASVLRLRTLHISSMSISLHDLLSRLTQCGSRLKYRLTKNQRYNFNKGLMYAIGGGGGLLLPVFFLPWIPDDKVAEFFGKYQPIQAGFCVMLVNARRYFQVNADVLLGIDKRPPILFLRSFSDDERELYSNANSESSVLDFSLETRLVNHFSSFGPFVAIGSPQESIPQIGAARLNLSDDEWQPRVQNWIKEASTLVMYSGATEWVNWELRQIVKCGRASSLILMMPEIKAHGTDRENNIRSRVEHVREVCKGTPWNEELITYGDFVNLRAMLFCADGSMIMIKSTDQSRDGYHLAALVAHYVLLHPTNTQPSTVTDVEDRSLRWSTALAWSLSGVLAFGAGVYSLTPDPGTRLTFKKGELYYFKPVTQAEASSVGEELIKQTVFSEDKAATVKLRYEQGRYQLGFVVDPVYAEKLLTELQFGAMGNDISREALAGKPIDVKLYDTHLKLIKALPPSALLMYGKSQLYYTAPIGLSEAQELGEWLRQITLFNEEKGGGVHFGREQGVYQLRFIIDQSYMADPGIMTGFIEISRGISEQILGGAAIQVHLCDGDFRCLKTERVKSDQAMLTFKKGQLYYTESVTQTDARNVGEYLVRQNIFTEEKAATVKLRYEQGRYQLGFVFDPVNAEKLSTAILLGAIGSDIGREVLAGKPVDVELYDDNWKLIKALPTSVRLVYGISELYYTDPISTNEAQVLGMWLVRNNIFTETTRSSVHFGREQGVYQLRLIIKQSFLADPRFMADYVKFSRAITEEVLGGADVQLHLCDGDFRTLKTKRVKREQMKE